MITYAQQPDDVGQLDLSKESSNKTIDKALVDGYNQAIQENKQVTAEYKTAAGIASQAVLTQSIWATALGWQYRQHRLPKSGPEQHSSSR